MSNKIYLSVIIPAYNEEKRLPKTIEEVSKYLKSQDYNYEIIVVNDGSKDNTAQAVRSLIQSVPNLKLLDNKENHGKGFVTRQGMLEAKGEYRVFTDADNSTSIDHVEKMWPQFEAGYDIVIGSRDIKGAVIAVPQPWLRRMVLGNSFNLLVQLICGLWGIWDTQCGFKGMTGRAAEDILPRCKIEKFAFDPEILVIARRLGYKIKEIPITWINDPNSTVKFNSMVKMGFDSIKIRLNLIKGIYNA
ncbi:MAG: glycosyltransferase family 2 protein [Candidatus Parcubacteria bacterium]|nr:glycosyltransferase family 2 protein [Candidatus Parcubacteria bacterium]